MPIFIPAVPAFGSSFEELKKARKVATNDCKAAFGTTEYTNLELGRGIVVPPSGLRHTLHSAQGPLIRACYVLPEILKSAKYIGTFPHKDGKPDFQVVKFQAKLQDGNKVLDAVIVTLEYRDPNKTALYFYDLAILSQ